MNNHSEPDSVQENASAKSSAKPSKLKWWARRLLWAAVIICCLFYAADFGYSRYVHSGIKSWEASVERNEDGIRVGCEAYSVGPVDSDTALLMVHGISDSPHIYRKVSGYLSEKKVRCRCMRLTGFGESVSEYQKANIAQWLEDVDREVKALKEKHSKVVIVAHSLGGAISIHYVANNPGRVDGLVLAAPAVDVSSKRSPVLKVRSWHKLLRSTLCFSRITYSPFGVDALDEKERENKLRTPYTPISVIDQVFELVDRNQEAPKKLKLPICFVLAEDDQVIDNAAAKKFAEKCASDKVKLQLLDRSAHAIPVDFQWKKFAEAIRLFVKDI